MYMCFPECADCLNSTLNMNVYYATIQHFNLMSHMVNGQHIQFTHMSALIVLKQNQKKDSSYNLTGNCKCCHNDALSRIRFESTDESGGGGGSSVLYTVHVNIYVP